MKAKRISAGVLSAIIALALIGCGEVDDDSSSYGKSMAADNAASENSSFVVTEKASEESSSEEENSSLVETEKVSEESSSEEENSSLVETEKVSEESSSEEENSSFAKTEKVSEESSSEEENSSFAETEKVSEESIAEEKTSSPDDSFPDDSAREKTPLKTAAETADKIEFFEQFPDNVYPCSYDSAVKFLKSTFGDDANVTELGEFMNALGKWYLKDQFDYSNGVSVLGEKFYSFSVDYDADDKTVYTVGFHKNPDLNTSEDGDPSPNDCKDSYNRLYTLIKEKYGKPAATFTPEQNGFIGVLWTDTSCGEIWLAWGEKIFGCEQADCI